MSVECLLQGQRVADGSGPSLSPDVGRGDGREDGAAAPDEATGGAPNIRVPLPAQAAAQAGGTPGIAEALPTEASAFAVPRNGGEDRGVGLPSPVMAPDSIVSRPALPPPDESSSESLLHSTPNHGHLLDGNQLKYQEFHSYTPSGVDASLPAEEAGKPTRHALDLSRDDGANPVVGEDVLSTIEVEVAALSRPLSFTSSRVSDAVHEKSKTGKFVPVVGGAATGVAPGREPAESGATVAGSGMVTCMSPLGHSDHGSAEPDDEAGATIGQRNGTDRPQPRHGNPAGLTPETMREDAGEGEECEGAGADGNTETADGGAGRYSATEGAGVILSRPLPLLAPDVRRCPPMPREDSAPEPVRRRRRIYGSDDRFRRIPAVDEALAELTRPREILSPAEEAVVALRRQRKASGTAMKPPGEKARGFTPQQRLLLLDTWTRSGLAGSEFAALMGVSKHTLYIWKKRFDESGPAGLEDAKPGGGGGRLPEVTRRAILMLKRSHPEYGCQRISDLLAHGPALPASAATVANVLREAGYHAIEQPTKRHPDKPRRFERPGPNHLWQTDLFTFVLKGKNRRLNLVAFLDDHSRFIVGWGLFSSASTELVVETLKTAVASFHAPGEILTDNGAQYVTWRGHSKFSAVCNQLGITQRVAKPRHPETLGKIERFWGTLWREFLSTAIFNTAAEARERIGSFVDDYNFERPHQGLDGLMPADRYFGRANDVKEALRRRLAENAAHLATVMQRADELTELAGELEYGDGPLTPDGSLPMGEEVDRVPGPGDDPLTAGLTAAVRAGKGGD